MRGPALVLLILALSPASLLAQAWVPPKGELYFDITYQWLRADDHLYSDEVLGPELTPLETLFGDLQSTSQDEGRIRSHAILMNADIGITDRLALSGGLAFVQAKFVPTGPASFPENPDIDDGAFHGDFQDARLGARYVLLDGSWVLTPSATVVLPVTDYPVLGHAAIGRNLKEAQFGVNVGRFMNIGGAPRAYLHGNYTYAVMEDTEIASLDRSNLQLELGFLHRAFTVQVFGAWEKIHGGIEWHNLGGHHDSLGDHEDPFEAVNGIHDQVAATRDFQLGGAVTFHVSDAADLFVALNDTVWGANTHDAGTLTFGVSWGLQAFGGIGPTRAAAED